MYFDQDSIIIRKCTCLLLAHKWFELVLRQRTNVKGWFTISSGNYLNNVEPYQARKISLGIPYVSWGTRENGAESGERDLEAKKTCIRAIRYPLAFDRYPAISRRPREDTAIIPGIPVYNGTRGSERNIVERRRIHEPISNRRDNRERLLQPRIAPRISNFLNRWIVEETVAYSHWYTLLFLMFEH